MSESIEEKMVSVNQKELSLLVTNIIPTSKYFELRFDNMQNQIEDLKAGQKEIRLEMDKRFEQVHIGQKELRLEMDKRFEQVDKRFEQVDKRFEQVDKRFEQVNSKLDQIMERIDVKIDTGLREGRQLTVKLFSFAMVFSAISMAGLLAKMTGLF